MWTLKMSRPKGLVYAMYIMNFVVISFVVFANIYDNTGYIVDELFHYPQGQFYCQMNFTVWDPKITTLPGLYLVSAALWGPANMCSLFWLRATNLLASIVNAYLFKVLCHMEQTGPNRNKPISWTSMLSSMNMALLPPLFFLSHVYYTDTLSVTFVLLAVISAAGERHCSAAIFGACSVMMRQTNIVWLAMLVGQHLINTFVAVTSQRFHRMGLKRYDFWDLYFSWKHYNMPEFRSNRKVSMYDIISVCSYLFVIVGFCVFVIMNGSIVVGDKSAHAASLHLPQLFYFSVFCAVFAFPHLCLEIRPFIVCCMKRKTVCLFLVTVFLAIVHFNTLVHPYLLADNRHYTFYIWNRFYGRYFYARYAMVFVYLFLIYALIKRTDFMKNFIFLICYLPCIVAVLTLQKMIDVRYFIIPFILIRSKFKVANAFILIAENLNLLAINIITFYWFFTLEIFWTDFPYPQRLMW